MIRIRITIIEYLLIGISLLVPKEDLYREIQILSFYTDNVYLRYKIYMLNLEHEKTKQMIQETNKKLEELRQEHTKDKQKY